MIAFADGGSGLSMSSSAMPLILRAPQPIHDRIEPQHLCRRTRDSSIEGFWDGQPHVGPGFDSECRLGLGGSNLVDVRFPDHRVIGTAHAEISPAGAARPVPTS